jgi:hypothetical protein
MTGRLNVDWPLGPIPDVSIPRIEDERVAVVTREYNNGVLSDLLRKGRG